MRRLPVLVIAAVGALTLAACGAQSGEGARTDARAEAASQQKSGDKSPASAAGASKQEVLDAFTIPEALLGIEKECGGGKELDEYLKAVEELKKLPEDAGAMPTAGTGDDGQATGEPVPADGQANDGPPDPQDFDPPYTGPLEEGKPESDRRDTCVFDRHTQRVTKALGSRASLTPDDVSAVLKDLGYPAKRIVGPARENGAVQFTLDLSLPFGPRCLSMGAADGKVAAVPHHEQVFANDDREDSEQCVQQEAVPAG
ncbi:hypothetical protein [Streptomyces indicus]|uniref:Secreted protein n=1 Tax=Streptomyces indicus TaxID=417292 RepID=A0A1G9CDV9_9ACTN|nr:hypothetical protein [Streptomyces indicus]SDK49839.1 hypothetical protein SAMN05421806_10879 [Streptomyces indicus]